LYVNLQGATVAAELYAQRGAQQRIPESVQQNLAPLRGLLLAANALDKDTLKISGFLGVQ
jgi:hypothetical protein